MARFVALLRGINVGGKQTVKMSELKALHEALGFQDVSTYINSGNVIFTCEETDKTALERRIEESFSEKFGFRVRIIVRSAAEFAAALARNPFQQQEGRETQWQVVLFLAERPEDAVEEELRKAYTGPEEFSLSGQELYLYYTNGIGRSKLTNALLEKKLKTAGTGRNWNTLLQLQKMLES